MKQVDEAVQATKSAENREATEPKVEVMVFTDPYCSWCWATEPMILSMMERYGDQLHISYVFGGLIRDMDAFYDATNDIADAAAVEPHWAMVSKRSGQPIDEKLWRDIGKIPHFSSWPANVAAKAAFMQGEKPGFDYLRRLRQAALTERTIISKRDEYNRLAQEVPTLNYAAFRSVLESGDAERAFQEDQEVCAVWQAYGFPTMLFYKGGLDVNNLSSLDRDNAVYVGGHRSMDVYDEVIHKLAPDIQVFEPRSEVDLLSDYGPMTERELGQVEDRSTEEELKVLAALEEEGKVVRHERVRGNLWSVKKDAD
ncbi:MAG: DsbA family protein [Eggerthellaceae bacterium]|jgi:putative protein-disulfide isomerase